MHLSEPGRSRPFRGGLLPTSTPLPGAQEAAPDPVSSGRAQLLGLVVVPEPPLNLLLASDVTRDSRSFQKRPSLLGVSGEARLRPV